MNEQLAVVNQKAFFIKIEKVCLFFTLFSIMFPLAKNFGLICIALVNIPMTVLAFLWFRRLIKTGEFFQLRLCLWDFLLLGLGSWVCFSTLLVAPDNIGIALCWVSMFFFAFYARVNINKIFDLPFIVRFAILALCLQLVVGFLQFFTHSYIGSISRYFGTLTKEITEIKPFIRVEGTLPQVNSFGMWIVMLSPFIYDRMLHDYHQKKYIHGNFLLILWLLCLLALIIAISRWNLVIMLLLPIIFLFLRTLRQKIKVKFLTIFKISVIIFLLGVLLLLFFSYAATYLFLNENFFSLRIMRIMQLPEHFAQRLHHYKLSIVAIKNRPFLGEGFYNGGNIWQGTDERFSFSLKPMRPHNVFLTLALENGVPALFIFCLIIAIPFTRYIRDFQSYGSSQDIFATVVLSYITLALIYLFAIEYWIWPLFMFLAGAFQGSLLK